MGPGLALALALATSAAVPSPAAPVMTATPATSSSAQAVVFFNARLSLREGRPKDVLRLWLLRNALRDQGQTDTRHDVDFRSVVWAALGETGYCPDGFIDDEGSDGSVGAGLWPLAVHNWLVKNIAKQPPSQPDPWGSFRGGQQQRPISLHDVLSLEELKTVRFYRAMCLTPWVLQGRLSTTTGALQLVNMDDRLSVGLMMKDVLDLAEKTLDPQLVEGLALLDTRRFDLDVALTRMQATKARQNTTLTDQILRGAGVSEGGRLGARQARTAAFAASAEAALWRRALSWSATDWLSLSQTRRLALFSDADVGVSDLVARQRVILEVIDALIARGDGAEVQAWLGFAARTTTGGVKDPVAGDVDDADGGAVVDDARARLLTELTLTERGQRLLGLEPATGFRERSAIALHRGVQQVKDGETIEALRSFAFALANANDSADAENVHRLSQRWLAFVLSQYETTEEVTTIIDAFVPTVDYSAVVESLLWRAAFHGDVDSFDRIVTSATARRSSSVKRLATQLRPLVEGDPARLWDDVTAEGSPASVVRFAQRLTDQLATEPVDVRANHRRTLELTIGALDDVVAGGSARGSLTKKATALLARVQSLRDVVGAWDDSVRGRVGAASPDRERYAGSIRLAPADALPWPFAPPAVSPPNPFAPIVLTPVEWRQADGQLVFGWSIHE